MRASSPIADEVGGGRQSREHRPIYRTSTVSQKSPTKSPARQSHACDRALPEAEANGCDVKPARRTSGPRTASAAAAAGVAGRKSRCTGNGVDDLRLVAA